MDKIRAKYGKIADRNEISETAYFETTDGFSVLVWDFIAVESLTS